VFEHRDRLKLESVSDLGDAYRLLAPPSPSESEPRTAKQLIRAAMNEMQEARDILETEEVSEEYAKLLFGELDKIKNRAKESNARDTRD
jgi:hypothetical protein